MNLDNPFYTNVFVKILIVGVPITLISIATGYAGYAFGKTLFERINILQDDYDKYQNQNK